MATDNKYMMLTMAEFAGFGVTTTEDGSISMAFTTDGPPIDVTMTKEQAMILADRLKAAAK